MNRREMVRTAMAGMLTLWASPPSRAARQEAERLTDRIAVLRPGGTNVLAFAADNGLVLVDSGVPGHGEELSAALADIDPGSRVQALFNTHYHLDHTGNNEQFGSAGVRIIAHDRTRQWMSTDYWLPDERRYEPARPEAAWPTETFISTGSMEADGERIDYGYLLVAHTAGDAYVYFRNANVLAVGDVASPVKDPELDWITGGWIGGRVDAMDLLLEIGNDDTRVVPGTGPVMTFAEFRAERELMEVVRQRLFKEVREGKGPEDMLDGGLLEGLERTWDDPYKFLYDAGKGLWGHHNKLDPNVV